MTAWMIRAGRGGICAEQWVDSQIIGIFWDLNGLDIAQASKEQIRNVYGNLNPSHSAGKIASAVGQIARFAHDMLPGQKVVMYNPATRLYHIGEITGPCIAAQGEEGLTYFRTAIWLKTARRDNLAPSSIHSLGSILTIFTIPDSVMADLEQTTSTTEPPSAPPKQLPQEEENAPSYSGPDDGIEAIKDRVQQISWEDMEQLVAGLLRAMGYYADVTTRGADGGRDVVASHDALGLDGSPRIVAEVKHREAAMGAPMIRAFIGGLHSNEHGLYVSTGGFTKDARSEALHASTPVRLVDLDTFVRLYIDNYRRMDDETRAILPLTCIWCPAD